MTNISIPQNEEKANKMNWALYYLEELGFSVVPADTKNKQGTHIKWKPYQEKKPTSEEVKNWWSRYPKAGIAIVTGWISDVIVLDVDPRHGGMDTISDKRLPKTWTVQTGGGGVHYYYKYPDVDQQIKNFTGDQKGLPGVDLRGDGGIVYAPPSLHPSGNRYSFSDSYHPESTELSLPPEWLMEVIIEDDSPSERVRVKNWGEKYAGVQEGCRNDTCAQLAGKLAYAGVPKENAKHYLLNDWNKMNTDSQGNSNPLPKKEVVQTVDNIYQKHESNSDGNGKFLPSEVADTVLELENQKGRFWCYLPENEVMYFYSQTEGYWKQKNSEYLKSEVRKVLKSLNPDWESRRNIRETMEALKHSLIDSKNYEIFNDVSRLDTRYINVKNGMLDWETGELKKHDPDYYSVFQMPVEHDPTAVCPHWKEALKDWIPSADTRNFLQEFVGYCLIPETSQQQALILLGSGSNGKSTFLELLTELFGEENLTNIPLHKLSNRFEVAYVHHSLVNICSDIDPTYLRETGVLKTMISGEKLRGEYKHGESFDFRPVVRLMFSTNELPRTKDKTDGWYRRFEIVKFPNQFNPGDPGFDPDLKTKLKEEIPGIFQWALEGLKRFKQQDGFTKSDDLEMTKNEYKCQNDSVKMFVEQKLERVATDEPKFTYPKKLLYEKYKRYCTEAGLQAQVTRRKFTRRLNEMGFEEARRRKTVDSISQNDGRELEFLDLPGEKKEKKSKNKSVRCFIKVDLKD